VWLGGCGDLKGVEFVDNLCVCDSANTAVGECEVGGVMCVCVCVCV